jgi:hypothetical protein
MMEDCVYSHAKLGSKSCTIEPGDAAEKVLAGALEL